MSKQTMPAAQIDFVQALYDNFPDPVIFVGADGNVLSVNAATVSQFGHAAENIVGSSAGVLYANHRDFERALRQNAAKPAGETFSEGIYRYRRRDETVFTARLRVTQLTAADGANRGFVGIIHDISDYLDLDRERKKAGEILNTALQVIPEGFAIFDKNERLLVCNDAYRRICGEAGPKIEAGMTAEEIVTAVYEAGQYPLAPTGAREAKAWIEKRLHDFRTPGGDHQVFQYGQGRWLRVEDLKTPDGNTVVLRIDVTELKQIELALDRQRLDYYTLVQNIPDFILRVSNGKAITFVNDRYARFAGLPADELIGKPFADFIQQADRESFGQLLGSLSPEGPTFSREEHRPRADGQDLWILWSIMAVFDGRTPAEYILVGRDITELKRQQSRIAQQSVDLSRKNEALNQFTATVSHDLKAPLRHISMFSDMIGEDVANGKVDELAVYARYLRQSARRMDQLIDSLLDYAQIADQIGTWETVHMADVISDAILDLGTFIREAGARFEFDALPQVRGDTELLKRLCQNLIGNAVKYRQVDTKPVIRIYGEKDGNSVRICFQDNGIGIDPRFANKIFDVFQRLHRDEAEYPGTGIGLALAKRIAESHNGSIQLDTSFTDGARFVLTLPETT